MYEAASGIQSLPSTGRRLQGATRTEITSQDASKFKIYYPSAQTVRESRGGSGYLSPFSPKQTKLNEL